MNLLKTLSTVSALTLLSRIAGLARESLKAFAFGAGLQMDAFEAAFRLPNILRRLFAEGAFSQAFVPILSEYQRSRGDAATHDLIGRIATLLAVVLVGLRIGHHCGAVAEVYLLLTSFRRRRARSDSRRNYPHHVRTFCSSRWSRSRAAC
jgi:putative peptidoglycan lipid II flippase